MGTKIIDSRRYKTITKTQLEKKRKKNEKAIKASKVSSKKIKSNKYNTQDSSSVISNLRIRKHREKKVEREMLLYSRPERTVLKEPKQKIYVPKSFVIGCAVLIGILVLYTAAKVIRIDEKISNSINAQDIEKEIPVTLTENYDFAVAVTSLYDTNVYSTTNVILNDLFKAASASLIKVKDNYTIEYRVAKSIVKNSETEYQVTINNDYKLTIEDIKRSVEQIRANSNDNSMYLDRISNIASIDEVESNKFNITLYNADPYFVYYLDFPLTYEKEKNNTAFNVIATDTQVKFNRADKNPNKNLNSVILSGYPDIDSCVEDFSNGTIDMFFATSNNEMQLIGKKDYNVKKYKDGETLFIFGNKNSPVFSMKEVRTALMYSLDREDIVKSSDNNFIEVIDLPFIYSSIKYKYDIVGAKNIMESYSWNKNGYGIYEKYDNSGYYNATLRLLVNQDDTNKVNVANNIKSMAYNAGINIEIEALSSDGINEKVANGDYDIVLASVFLNDIPDISFIRDYVDINDATKQAFTQVEQSSVEELSNNVQNLEFVLSDEVACIGIYARNINLVYQKYIYGLENLNYMTIFSNIDNIGKIEGEE